MNPETHYWNNHRISSLRNSWKNPREERILEESQEEPLYETQEELMGELRQKCRKKTMGLKKFQKKNPDETPEEINVEIQGIS